MPPQQHIVLRWSAYEHEHVDRTADWYLALGIIALCAAIISILFHNFLFAVLILVAAVTIGLLAKTPPELMHFEVSDKGVRVGGKLHRYDDIISFWVEDELHARPLLLIDTVKFLSPNLIIPLDHINPAMVRAYLKERVKEVPMHEPIAHKIFEFLGI